nr:hypothetical protein [Tanacetum cinerariifolium]
ELLLKERNNSLSELGFEIHGLSRTIYHAKISNSEVKGVTTIGGKTTTETIHKENINIHTRETQVSHDEIPITPSQVLIEDEPQKTNEQIGRPSIEPNTSISFSHRLRKEKKRINNENSWRT